MVEVIIRGEGKELEIEITGHAGYKGKGNDIVCSAISTIAFTTFNYIKMFLDKNAVITSVDTIGENNNLLYFKTSKIKTEEIALLIKLFTFQIQSVGKTREGEGKVTITIDKERVL